MGQGGKGKPTTESSFKSIYTEYYAPLCLYAGRFIEDSAICEDIVTDVFALLWRRRNELILAPETALAYLKISIRNGCLNYLKHQQYAAKYAENIKKHEPVYATSPDTVYSLEELQEMLRATLEKLPENYREVFIKSFWDGDTQQEIAEKLNLSVKSVGRYKQKSIEALRKGLKEYLPAIITALLPGLF